MYEKNSFDAAYKRKPVECLQSSLWHDSFAPFISYRMQWEAGEMLWFIMQLKQSVPNAKNKHTDERRLFLFSPPPPFRTWRELKHPGNLIVEKWWRSGERKKNRVRLTICPNSPEGKTLKFGKLRFVCCFIARHPLAIRITHQIQLHETWHLFVRTPN